MRVKQSFSDARFQTVIYIERRNSMATSGTSFPLRRRLHSYPAKKETRYCFEIQNPHRRRWTSSLCTSAQTLEPTVCTEVSNSFTEFQKFVLRSTSHTTLSRAHVSSRNSIHFKRHATRILDSAGTSSRLVSSSSLQTLQAFYRTTVSST